MTEPKDPEESQLDFSMVIASTVHDMKNSLGMFLQAFSTWVESLPPEQAWNHERGVIEYESGRLNGMLMQLLGLYKMNVNQLPLHPEWQDLEDFLEAQRARYQELLQSRSIDSEIQLAEDVFEAFFDRDLMGTVIANIIINTVRYARSKVILRAYTEDDFTVLSVEDDGAGYPAAMLEGQAGYVLGIKQSTGSTGLGLYFAGRIAALHQRNGVHGFIRVQNGGSLGGGVFSIHIP